MTEPHRTGTTVFLATAFFAYTGATLAVDTTTGLWQQMALGCTTWVFLAVALRCSPPRERRQVLAMVLVATCFETLGSILLGVYRYRLDNLPLFVPPGHGLFFLVAVRLADLPWLRQRADVAIGVVAVASVLLVARGLLLSPTPDVFGLGTWIILTGFLRFSRYPLLYALSFAMTMVLEFYGTTLGNWAWAAAVPLVGLPAGNPPAAIGAGYCIMDALARLLSPRLSAVPQCVRRLTWAHIASNGI